MESKNPRGGFLFSVYGMLLVFELARAFFQGSEFQSLTLSWARVRSMIILSSQTKRLANKNIPEVVGIGSSIL